MLYFITISYSGLHMRNDYYEKKREQWRAMIRQRDDRSEIVNYDDPSFPSYSFQGHMDGSSPWIRKAHWHEDVEFMTVLTGNMAYNISGSIIEVHPGETIFINSKQLHYSMDWNNEYCTYIITIIHPKILVSTPEVESEYILPVIANPDIPYILWRSEDKDTPSITKAAKEINASRGNQFEITRHFFALWHFVLQRAGSSIKEQSLIHIQNIESLKNMIGYIKNNYRDHISLDLIAKVGCMSKSSCNNLFKKYTGHTPIDYLIRYRLDKAMELMSTSDESIGNISSKCGFASSGYMTEQFVRCYGFTPREFRNSIG